MIHHRHLFVQSQQWQHQSSLWNLFNVNKPERRQLRRSGTLIGTLDRFRKLFWCFYCCNWNSKSRVVWNYEHGYLFIHNFIDFCWFGTRQYILSDTVILNCTGDCFYYRMKAILGSPHGRGPVTKAFKVCQRC